MSRGPVSYLVRHAHALVSSAGHLARAPIATVFTVLVMGLALALPLGLDVLVRNVREATGNFSGAVGLSAYLRTEVTEQRAQQLAATARARAGVGTVTLITAEQALRQFRAQSGFGAALDALEGNPCRTCSRSHRQPRTPIRPTSNRCGGIWRPGPKWNRCSSTAPGWHASTRY